MCRGNLSFNALDDNSFGGFKSFCCKEPTNSYHVYCLVGRNYILCIYQFSKRTKMGSGVSKSEAVANIHVLIIGGGYAGIQVTS